MHLFARLKHCVLASFCLFLSASVASGQGQDSAAPNQNVEVLDLGPAPATGGFASIAMTSDYRHIAVVGPSGSRTSAFVDGHAGDKYDQIMSVPPVLSADGKHWAYTARKGSQGFMVVDGKEYGPYDGFPPYVRSGAGAVDMQETRRMIGSGGAAVAANAPAGAPASVATVPATPGAPAQAQNVPPAGTTVEVRMMEAVDSSRDPAGKQYRATVTKEVSAGNIVVGQGTAATVTLARNASGWVAQLSSLTVNSQSVAVASSSASVTSAAQSGAASATDAVSSVIGIFGKKPTLPPPAVAVATGGRVFLPPGITLSFILAATSQPSGTLASPGVAPSASTVPSAQPAAQANAAALAAQANPAPAQNQQGKSYFCAFNNTAKPLNLTSYFSGTFQADADQRAVAQAWTQYIRQTYVPDDSRDQGVCQIGTADQQQRMEAQRRQAVQALVAARANANAVQKNALTQNVVHVDWKYAPAAGAPSAIGAAAGQAGTAAASAPTAPSGTAATQGKIYFCENMVTLDAQNRQYKMYWSDVFASDAKQADITNAWRVYLATTYQLNPHDVVDRSGCGDVPTVQYVRELNASRKQHWESRTKILQDRLPAGSPGIVERHTVVDTGWKYTPDQAVAAAPAPAIPPCAGGNKPAGGNIPCGVPATAPAAPGAAHNSGH